MSDPGRWALLGTLVMIAAFVSPGIASAIPATLPAAVGLAPSVVFPSGQGGGNGGGHGHGGGGGFTCPTIRGADSSVCSTNWAGFADTGANGSVTAVSGAWTVPSLSCPKHGTTYVAIWVGIDGYSSGTVEQTGTMGICNHGSASYSAWYEFYPNPSYTIPVTVTAGDHIVASVTYSSTTGQYTTSLSVNGGTAQTQSSAVAGAPSSSAEWIVERPALCTVASCRLTTLADFATATFSGASATVSGTSGSISSFSSVAITMVGSATGPILAQPSALPSSGTSFSVTFG